MQTTNILTLLLVFVSATCLQSLAQTKSHLQQANSLAGHGQYEKAIVEYKEALKVDGNNFSVHHMYGRTMALSGDMYGAIQEYRQAVKLKPNDAELLNDLGVALSASGELGEAIPILKQSIKANPKFIAAYNNLGSTLLHQGEYQGAIDAFQSSLKMQPSNQFIIKKLKEAQEKLSSKAAGSGGKNESVSADTKK